MNTGDNPEFIKQNFPKPRKNLNQLEKSLPYNMENKYLRPRSLCFCVLQNGYIKWRRIRKNTKLEQEDTEFSLLSNQAYIRHQQIASFLNECAWESFSLNRKTEHFYMHTHVCTNASMSACEISQLVIKSEVPSCLGNPCFMDSRWRHIGIIRDNLEILAVLPWFPVTSSCCFQHSPLSWCCRVGTCSSIYEQIQPLRNVKLKQIGTVAREVTIKRLGMLIAASV